MCESRLGKTVCESRLGKTVCESRLGKTVCESRLGKTVCVKETINVLTAKHTTCSSAFHSSHDLSLSQEHQDWHESVKLNGDYEFESLNALTFKV